MKKAIINRLNSSQDPLGRGQGRYETVEVDDSYPDFILKNKEHYSYLIKDVKQLRFLEVRVLVINYSVCNCSIAHTRGLDFGVKDTGWSGDKRYNQSGFYWFDLDWGQEVPDGLDVYYEKEVRKKLNTCHHDMTVGCDVRGYDQGLMDVPDNTIIFGNIGMKSTLTTTKSWSKSG